MEVKLVPPFKKYNMTTPIDYVTPKKLAEDSGLSRAGVIKLLNTGDIIFSKNGKSNTAGLMISISSFNRYWKSKNIIKK